MNDLMVKNICPSCGTAFDSKPEWNKKYCTLKCRNREKRHRHKSRDLHLHPETVTKFYAEVCDPTPVQLGAYAKLLSEELTDDKPVRFYGVVPAWTPTDGILFVEQQGVTPPEWVMFHPAMVD